MERLVIFLLVVHLLAALPQVNSAAAGMCETIYTVYIHNLLLYLVPIEAVKLCGIIINALISESLSNDINSLV